MNQPIKNPLLVGANKGFKQHTNNVPVHDTANSRSGKMTRKIFNRNDLPAPIDYYCEHFPNLPIHTDRQWLSVPCCFHDDKNPSLRINLISGGFYCFGCSAKGGDVIAFHMQRYGIPFVAAVTFFGAWTYEK
jgi:hypothetical protein